MPRLLQSAATFEEIVLGVEVSFTHYARPWTLNAERAGNRYKRASMVREWREAFAWLSSTCKLKFDRVDVHVEIHMKRPLADTGNAYGSVKAAIDGLVDSGVLPDDGPNVIMRLCMDAPRPVKAGERESLTVTLKGEPV